MPDHRQIVHFPLGQPPGRVLIPRARWCANFTSKLRGFTFRRQLAPEDGLVLVEGQDSRAGTAIHMLFVFFDLGVIWVNAAGRVVDKKLARPWRLSYVPREPARYVIEGHPLILESIQIGDNIRFEEYDET